jgi:hypothetical protein
VQESAHDLVIETANGSPVAAAAMAALRRRRRFAQALGQISIEPFLALGAAEVIRLPGLLGVFKGVGRLFVRAAHWTFTPVVLANAISP